MIINPNATNLPYAWQMIDGRAKVAVIYSPLCNHSFRGTGITTIYLQKSGILEKAQQMTAHESLRTTKLDNYTDDKMLLNDI